MVQGFMFGACRGSPSFVSVMIFETSLVSTTELLSTKSLLIWSDFIEAAGLIHSKYDSHYWELSIKPVQLSFI